MARTVDEIKRELKHVKELRFYEEMADFMNWGAYNEYTAQINKLEAELKEAENDGARGKENN